jgi:hypothetical protein
MKRLLSCSLLLALTAAFVAAKGDEKKGDGKVPAVLDFEMKSLGG